MTHLISAVTIPEGQQFPTADEICYETCDAAREKVRQLVQAAVECERRAADFRAAAADQMHPSATCEWATNQAILNEVEALEWRRKTIPICVWIQEQETAKHLDETRSREWWAKHCVCRWLSGIAVGMTVAGLIAFVVFVVGFAVWFCWEYWFVMG
jgi:hypothetical protein